MDAHNAHLVTVNLKKILLREDLTPLRPVMWKKKQISVCIHFGR